MHYINKFHNQIFLLSSFPRKMLITLDAVFPSPKDKFQFQPGLIEVICFTEFSIFSTSNPANMLDPASIVSGLSVLSLICNARFFEIKRFFRYGSRISN